MVFMCYNQASNDDGVYMNKCDRAKEWLSWLEISIWKKNIKIDNDPTLLCVLKPFHGVDKQVTKFIFVRLCHCDKASVNSLSMFIDWEQSL